MKTPEKVSYSLKTQHHRPAFSVNILTARKIFNFKYEITEKSWRSTGCTIALWGCGWRFWD